LLSQKRAYGEFSDFVFPALSAPLRDSLPSSVFLTFRPGAAGNLPAACDTLNME